MEKKIRNIFLVLNLVAIQMFCQEPNWVVNSTAFNLDASLIVRIKVGDEFLSSENDKVAAFDVSGQVRGVAQLQKRNGSEEYVAYLSVFSNTSNEQLSFKIYDSLKDEVIEIHDRFYNFIPNDVVGNVFEPYLLETSSTLSAEKLEGKEINSFVVKNGFLFVETTIEVDEVELIDALGKSIYKESLRLKSNQFKIPVQECASGMYIVKIKSLGKLRFVKLIL